MTTKQEVIDGQEKELEELYSQLNGVQASLDEGTGLNDRLNRTLKAEREKIGKLKEVAKFYRAQRDRVDAYLSAVLDTLALGDVQRKDRHMDYAEPANTAGVAGVSQDKPKSHALRPRIQEPFVHGDAADDGRTFATYRDHEPGPDWEDF